MHCSVKLVGIALTAQLLIMNTCGGVLIVFDSIVFNLIAFVLKVFLACLA